MTPNSKVLLRLENINHAYRTQVLCNVQLEVRGVERIHLAGPNGSGKTTLLKIAAGLLQPNAGERIAGTGVSIGYFSQEVDGLDHARSGLENLLLTGAELTTIYKQARSLGLDETALRQPLSQLSRGQQAKLSFAKLLLGSHHLLVLDEPTNHLDISTREQIETALQNYAGALLVASHDEYFIQTIRPQEEVRLSY